MSTIYSNFSVYVGIFFLSSLIRQIVSHFGTNPSFSVASSVLPSVFAPSPAPETVDRMTSPIKSIEVWGQGGPNPPKVAIVLEELGVPCIFKPIEFSDVKKPEFLAINPNGRLPAIHDPNTDLTLWESGAIIEYLIERYDTENLLGFAPGTAESYLAKQWLYFQTTGQGPYYGQAIWFKKYHAEQLPSAIDRYVKEINRVSGVLEGHLARQKEKVGGSAPGDGPWLVSDKFSYADLAFIPWQFVAGMFFPKEEYTEDDYPLVKEWLGRMTSREAVKSVLEKAFKPLS